MILAGFLASAPVHTALAIAGGAAIVSGVVGTFTIIRGQAFAGHALADVSSTGGAAALLLGISPMLGFLGAATLAAAALEFLGGRQARARDLATGIILGFGLGLTALLLYLDVTTRHSTGAAISVMFGSMFVLPGSLILYALGAGAAALGLIALIWRPLLLASAAPDLAAVRGIPVRLTGLAHLAVLSLAVTLAAMTIGAILSTALLIGPAATALRLARRPAAAAALAAAIGLSACWAGIALAYASYNWTPGRIWPVSFFITTLICLAYLASLARRPA